MGGCDGGGMTSRAGSGILRADVVNLTIPNTWLTGAQLAHHEFSLTTPFGGLDPMWIFEVVRAVAEWRR